MCAFQYNDGYWNTNTSQAENESWRRVLSGEVCPVYQPWLLLVPGLLLALTQDLISMSHLPKREIRCAPELAEEASGTYEMLMTASR